MKIKEMRQRVADLKKDGREKQARLDAIAALDGDDVTDAITAEAATLVTACDALADDLEAAQAALDVAERKLRNDRAFAPDPVAATGVNRVFDPNPTTTHGFKSMAEYARAVRSAGAPSGTIDERLLAPFGTDAQGAPVNFHRETGSEGYLVPPAMRDEIFEAVAMSGDTLVNDVDIEPTEGNSISVLTDETTPWGSSGLVANWAGEGAKLDASKIETKGQTVKINSLNVFVLASQDLIDDAPRLSNLLTRKAGEAVGWKATSAIVSGDRVGKPWGYRPSGAYVTVPKEAGQAANTLVAENVAKMYARMLPASIQRAFWMMNPDVLPQLMTMTLGDQPIWTPPASGFANAPGGFLFGRPVRLSQHNETLGTKGDIEFIDPKGYLSPRKNSGINFSESMHLFFDYGVNAYRWTFRMGGQPHLSAPVSPAKGSAAQSHFVGLATRS